MLHTHQEAIYVSGNCYLVDSDDFLGVFGKSLPKNSDGTFGSFYIDSEVWSLEVIEEGDPGNAAVYRIYM